MDTEKIETKTEFHHPGIKSKPKIIPQDDTMADIKANPNQWVWVTLEQGQIKAFLHKMKKERTVRVNFPVKLPFPMNRPVPVKTEESVTA